MRKSTFFSLFILLNLFLLALVFVYSSFRQRADRIILEEMGEMTRRFEITDLCLFTEANYTRHITQADLHTPFQDGPFSLEHFPSGAIVPPPEAIKRMNEKLD
ncbi:MAG: hypothetical protein OEW23_15110 [Candidatus Aminicenantes bacterium]|nr:hypothetical protein [Candidatus Aminicenantes bacterium]